MQWKTWQLFPDDWAGTATYILSRREVFGDRDQCQELEGRGYNTCSMVAFVDELSGDAAS
jgi:hypothetical protein